MYIYHVHMYTHMCYSVLQRVAVYCSVLQCIVVRYKLYSVLPSVSKDNGHVLLQQPRDEILLQCVALCCIVLQCFALCIAVHYSVIKCVAVCGSVFPKITATSSSSSHLIRSSSFACMLQCVAVCCSVTFRLCVVVQCVAVCCSVLQCVLVCCSVLQYVAV